ncbi:MAG: hypothetical protein ACRDTM_15890 [Micromonosporaceae bacterium]
MVELLRRRWLLVLVGVWSALLLVLAFVSYGGDATVSGQRDIADTRAVVDRATVELVNAAGGDAAVRVGRFEFVKECFISFARDGVAYRRVVELYPETGGEAALIRTLARRLPAAYEAKFFRLGGKPHLSGYADPYLPVRGTVSGGAVRIDLTTECHPSDRRMAILRTAPSAAERAEVAEALELAGGVERRPEWRTETVDCGGNALRTVRLRVAGAASRPLGDAAGLAPPDARVLVGEQGLLAYRQGAVSVVVEARGGGLTVTTTTSHC